MKLAYLGLALALSSVVGCAAPAGGADVSGPIQSERITSGTSALTFEAPANVESGTPITVRLESTAGVTAGVKEGSFRVSDVSRPADAAALSAFMSSVDPALRAAAQQTLLARGDATGYAELALVSYVEGPQSGAQGGAVHADGYFDYGLYAICFYSTWAGGKNAVDAGDHCASLYL